MIHFIICEDIPYFSNRICQTIDKLMKDLNLKCEKHLFKEYNEDFEKLINSNLENKVYVLDIVIPNKKGTEIAKIIRENDLDSFIIFITQYCDEFDKDVLTNNYMFLKFIDKSKDYAFELYETLYKSFRTKKKDVITIDSKDTSYRFNESLVTHIFTKDRKSVICYGDGKTAEFTISLKQLKEQLNNNFLFSKNCCIVNCDRITYIDKINRIITFDNDSSVDMVSKKYLKELLEKVKCYV